MKVTWITAQNIGVVPFRSAVQVLAILSSVPFLASLLLARNDLPSYLMRLIKKMNPEFMTIAGFEPLWVDDPISKLLFHGERIGVQNTIYICLLMWIKDIKLLAWNALPWYLMQLIKKKNFRIYDNGGIRTCVCPRSDIKIVFPWWTDRSPKYFIYLFINVNWRHKTSCPKWFA